MAKFFSVFFVIAILFVQQNQATVNIFDLQGTANQLIADAQNAIAQATTAAQNLNQAAVTAATNLESTLQSTINAAFEATNNTINAIVSKAAGLGADAQGCIESHQSEIQNFTTTELKYLAGCVTEKIEKAISLATSLVADAQTLTTLVQNFWTDLSAKCPNPFNPFQIFCTFPYLVEVTAEFAVVTTRIAVNVVEATALVSSLATIQVDLPACLTTRVAIVAAQSLPLIAELTVCTITA